MKVKCVEGITDLATLRPDLLKEWDFEKNDIKPTKIGINSSKKVWWKCVNGHSYSCSVYQRNKGIGCGFCSGRYAIQGVNDLETVYPDIAREWNFEKNIGITPSSIKAHSNRKVWWKCEYGHEWQSTVANRVAGRGCPDCSNAGTSMVEQGVAFYLSKIYTISQREKINGYEIDIYLTDYDIGIEYDGLYYHSSDLAKNREKNKEKALENIKLIRIKESIDREDNEVNIIYYKPDGMRDSYVNMIYRLISLLSSITNQSRIIDVNPEKDILKIRQLYSLKRKENSLAYLYPDLVKEWNYTRNGKLTPDMFNIGTHQKVWWICDKGHEWKAGIVYRVKGTGCPYCSGRNAIKGVNDLETLYPDLLKEWDFKKNIINPDSITAGSSKKIWWLCKNGHSYQQTPQNRIKNNCGCPICSNTVCLEGFNDLKTCFPLIAEEWDLEKNDSLPQTVLAGSHKKVWWKCKKGHSYKATIESRTRAGTGCPFCAGRKVQLGDNDLLSNYQLLAKEWNYEKNGNLKPEDVTVFSNRRVWWKCSYGHEWQTSVSHRTIENTNCPYCAGQKTIKGFNDLLTVNPKLAKEWNYEKNNNLSPDMFMPKSGRRVWWKCCSCGYEWESTIVNRTIRKSGCPMCKHKWIND